MVKLVDTLDLGSSTEKCVSSSLTTRTNSAHVMKQVDIADLKSAAFKAYRFDSDRAYQTTRSSVG